MAAFVDMNEKDGAKLEDTSDGRSIFGFKTAPVTAYPQLPTGKDDPAYFMKHKNRGSAVIFNHRVFEPHLRLQQRNGTDADASNLYHTLGSLGFKVDLKNDKTYKEVMDILEKYSEEDHSDSDCFLVCILSHGEYGSLFSRDQMYKPDSLWSMFTADKVRSLAGKPKLFFIQACQGDQLDSGVTVQRRTGTDGPSSSTYKIPVQADFLIAYSTVPGYFSWRNTTNGSWFIQALCKVLREYSGSKDLLSMMTVVCRTVAFDFESNTPSNQQMHQKRQIPFITTMLTRDIIFEK